MPSDPRPLQVALALAADGKTAEAEASLLQLARQQSDPVAAWHLAWLRLRQGEAEGALAILREFPTDPACNERALEQLIGERRNAEAQALLKVAPHFPDDPRSLVAIAIAQHLSGNYKAAVDACRKALVLKPAYAPAHNHLGRALHNHGQAPAALAEFQRAVHADPRYPEAWHNLGHSLRARDDLPGAIEALQRALAISPGYRSARLNLGITLFAQDLPEPALACFEDLLRRDRDDIEAMVNAGLCLQALGDTGKARQRFELALERVPRHQWAHFYLGVLLSELADWPGAKAALRQALALRGDDPDAWAELAAVHDACGEADEAARALRSGLTLAPGHALLNTVAARLDRRRGDPLGAEARLGRIDGGRLPARLRQRYLLELGSVLDRNARSDAAFQAFEQANALAAQDPRWLRSRPPALAAELSAIGQWQARGAPGIERGADGDADQGADLCFVAGFPRSAHARMDEMLGAHPDLAVVDGRPTLEPVVHTLAGLAGGYPAAIAALDRGDRAALRKVYRLALARHGIQAGKRILDRTSLCAPHAGLVQALFPQARLLVPIRHPCDVVLANFMHARDPRAGGLDFMTLEQAVRSYDAVMSLWHQGLPLLSLARTETRHEALAQAPEPALAALFAFLDLPWDPAWLDQAPPPRPDTGRTPRAAFRWHRYRAQLQPFMPVLAPHAARLGYRID